MFHFSSKCILRNRNGRKNLKKKLGKNLLSIYFLSQSHVCKSSHVLLSVNLRNMCCYIIISTFDLLNINRKLLCSSDNWLLLYTITSYFFNFLLVHFRSALSLVFDLQTLSLARDLHVLQADTWKHRLLNNVKTKISIERNIVALVSLAPDQCNFMRVLDQIKTWWSYSMSKSSLSASLEFGIWQDLLATDWTVANIIVVR